MKIKKGFTLSELLITLGIVGVVAALTVPSLTAEYKKHSIEVQFMKSFGALQHAANQARLEHDGVELWEACGVSADSTTLAEGMKCFAPYMSGYIEHIEGSTSVLYHAMGVKSTGSNYIKINNGGELYIFKAKDGTEFLYDTVASYGQDPNKLYVYTVFIDTNGRGQKPNIVGRDAFKVEINTKTGEVYPYGSNEWVQILKDISVNTSDTWTTKCYSGGVTDGNTCAGSILDNGGKITYPWK